MEKAKIMIVEDEFLIAMSLKHELSNLGYEVCKLVGSGDVAIKNTEQEKPNIILMDIILKGEMNGIEAAKIIRSRHHDLPIIFVTGCEDEGTRKLAKDVGAVAYFTKPIETEELILAIEKALSK